MAIQRSCILCQKIFETKLFYVKKGQGKFCSAACQYTAARKGKVVPCAICKKEIYRKPHLLKLSQSGKYFCSKSCQTLWRNGKYIGIKHANWKDGLYAYRSVLSRHGVSKICRLCKTDDARVLAVHHIDQNRKNNKVDNLAWLCHNCHHLVHHHAEAKEKFMATIV